MISFFRKSAAPAPTSATRPAPLSQRAQRIHDCLIGGAVGDGLGCDIEFLDITQIQNDAKLTAEPPRLQDGTHPITDDTQMTLFTAEGLVRGLRGDGDVLKEVHAALLRWYVTQGGKPQINPGTGGILDHQFLHVRRAPGNTCMSGLANATAWGRAADNTSRGCGTIMRVAPLAFLPRGDIIPLTMTTSALTHGDQDAQDSAAAWALILNDLLHGRRITEAAERCLGRFGELTDNALHAALSAPRDGHWSVVQQLGGAWVADEALAIALYSTLCARTAEEGWRIAVLHSGDSDTTGAIAGNALGILFPEEVRTHPWAKNCEARDVITGIARDLDAVLDIKI